MELLTDDQITAELTGSPGWTLANGEITRTFTRDDFRGAMLLVGAVAFLAEKVNHHPDIDIRWNQVTLALVTHSAGGLTAADFDLARRISALTESRSG
ncbi:MAG TPA: 4a-hydroxytetrahydrobiopterin dehydratase [Streptosporangiaceae bacterium]